MAEKASLSRGGFHFDVDDPPSSVSKTPSFSDFSIRTTGPHHVPAPPPLPPPRRGWVSVAELTADHQMDDRSAQLPSGTYVVQFPKEQIFSYPPPENSIKFETFSRRKPRRSPCCTCLRYTLVFLFILVILAATAAAILYLIFKPVGPDYTLSSISIHGFNLTSSSPAPFSPSTFDISIQAENPNKKLGIYYLADAGGNKISVSYQGIKLATGILPEFFQPAKNLTVLQSALKGSNVVLTDGIRSTMMKDQNQKMVALRLDVKAPVKMKAGALKTWTIKVKLKCDFTVDSLDGSCKILYKKCDYKFKLF